MRRRRNYQNKRRFINEDRPKIYSKPDEIQERNPKYIGYQKKDWVGSLNDYQPGRFYLLPYETEKGKREFRPAFLLQVKGGNMLHTIDLSYLRGKPALRLPAHAMALSMIKNYGTSLFAPKELNQSAKTLENGIHPSIMSDVDLYRGFIKPTKNFDYPYRTLKVNRVLAEETRQIKIITGVTDPIGDILEYGTLQRATGFDAETKLKSQYGQGKNLKEEFVPEPDLRSTPEYLVVGQDPYVEFGGINGDYDLDSVRREVEDIIDREGLRDPAYIEIVDTRTDDVVDLLESTELVQEVGTWKKVVRKGKKVRKLDCPDGYKAKDGRCERMSREEIRNRKRSAKKRRTSSSKKKQAARKRKKSNKRR